MACFLGVTLSKCYEDIQGRLDIEKILNDMVSVVEINSMENDLLDLRKQLHESHNLTETLSAQTSSLMSEKNRYDAEFERIRSEAVSVREFLVHDVACILSESRQIEKYQKRIRDLEERESELVHFVKYGGGRSTDCKILPNLSTAESQSNKANSSTPYEFADSFAEQIRDDMSGNLSVQQICTFKRCPELVKDLEDKTLLLYLSFLDVSEVLNVSQINRQLFARLDQLFQNGSSIVKKSWLIHTPSSKIMSITDKRFCTSTLPPVVELNDDPSDGSSPAAVTLPDAEKFTVLSAVGIAAVDRSPAASRSPAGEGRYFGKFSMLLAAADNLLPTALTAGVMNAVGVKMNVPSSPASSNSSGNSSSSNIASSSRNTPISNGSSHAISQSLGPGSSAVVVSSSQAASSNGGLTREIAISLSKKLSAAEMKAIISMDEMLKRNSITLETSVADNEDLTSKLQGILTMRDFLIDKLKSAELALKAIMVEAASLKGQAQADEEIINYLDLRGQEFEGRNVELTLKSEQLQAAYNLQCGSYSHRENQMFSELAEYKAKYNDLEANYKSHKRILVKEVKSLRSQLGIASSERNKYISQLLTVRTVLNLEANTGV